MKKKKLFIPVTIIIITISALSYLIFSPGKDDIHILTLLPRSTDASLSAEYLNAQRTVNYYRDQIEKNPDDIKNYIELAQVFIQEARITGKHHEYVPKILRLLEDALILDNENLDANLTKASVLLSLHQFEEAKKIGEWAVDKYPYNPDVYGVLCDASVELGQYEKAVVVCDKMLSVKPDLRSYSRASYLRELNGELEAAIDAMRMAADAGVTGHENRAWVLYNLANLYLQSGKVDTAEFIYNGILEERPGYAYAFSGLAKVMIVRNDYSRAIEYLKNANEYLDDHSFFERLADIYLATGNREEEQKLISTVMKEFDEHEKAGWNVNLEYAAFNLNHNLNLGESLLRVEKEYKRRPGNIEVIDTYSWALYKNGKVNEALKMIEKVFYTNSKNPLYFYHAGVIFKAADKNEQAAAYFESALNENLAKNVLFYKDAKARLSELKSVAFLR